MKQYCFILLFFIILFICSCPKDIGETTTTTLKKEGIPSSWNGDYYYKTGVKYTGDHWRIYNGNMYTVNPQNSSTICKADLIYLIAVNYKIIHL